MSFNLKSKLTIVILGRSGCGKGTQAQFVAGRLKDRGVMHISTGALLRKLMRRKTPAGQITRRIMEQGGLHPSWVAAYAWFKVVFEEGGGKRHLVFDGAPRRLWEAKLLDEVIRSHERPPPFCIYIDVSRAEAMRRLLARGRADDTVLAIKRRLDYFLKDVVPVLRYYQRSGRLVRVNGEPPPHEVFAEIDKTLSKRLGKRWPQK